MSESLFPGELKVSGGRVWSWDGAQWREAGEVSWE
jgi:hypothetical protein